MAHRGATAGLQPTAEKSNCLRLIALLLDGGSLALKTQFDLRFPPATLSQDLQDPGNYQILCQLKAKKILTSSQFNLLFPQQGKVADSSEFDISLLASLIQNLPAFQQQNSAVWKQPGPPAPADVTLAADVKRLRCLRNKMFHSSSAELPDHEFEQQWKELSATIERLCPGKKELPSLLASLRQQSIDPVMEKKYEERLKQWTDFGLHLEILENEMEDVKSNIRNHDQNLQISKAELEKQAHIVEDLQAKTERQERMLDTCSAGLVDQKEIIEELRATDTKQDALLDSCCVQIADLQTKSHKQKESVKDVQESVYKMAKAKEHQRHISPEYRALISRSSLLFEEKDVFEYIETAAYRKAKEILQLNKILILQGNPGEGKTAMAKHLFLSMFDPKRCLNLAEPSDWKCIDFSLNVIDAILIDDIFGTDIFDESLLKEWERKLKSLPLAVKKYGISVIITGRHYILEESKRILRSSPLFKKENTQVLSSKDLTTNEKMHILQSHLTAEDRHTGIDTRKCSSTFDENSPLLRYFVFDSYVFGFPECVRLFASQDELFNKGPQFFARPKEFVRLCIHQLSRDSDKFLALIMVWANKGLLVSELSGSQMPGRVRKIVEKYNFSIGGKLVKRLKESLDYHTGGLIHFSQYCGYYTFSHSIVRDMVGLVVTKEEPDKSLEFCSREFFFKYITTKAIDDEFKVSVGEFLYDELVRKLFEIMFFHRREHTSLPDLHGHPAARHCGRKKEMQNRKFDFLVLKHDCFQNNKFVDKFLNYVSDNGYLDFLLSSKVMTISGLFLGYGINIGHQPLYTLSYAAFVKADALADKIISRKLPRRMRLSDYAEQKEYYMTLLSAIHHQSFDVVKSLVRQGTRVSEEALYIAAHGDDINILYYLILMKGEQDGNKSNYVYEKSQIVNGNNALIAASKKGLLGAVKCFIDNGYNLEVTNDSGYAALDKAIASKHEDVCEVLLNAGADFDMRAGKFGRTPIHAAANVGLRKTTKLLLEKGAALMVKDRKGFYPIHSAAMNGHVEIVETILKHDRTSAYVPIKAYGEKSVLKGKTVFHIAIFKKNYELLKLLLDMKVDPDITDFNGRTPFFTAVRSGYTEAVILLKDISDINIRDRKGCTALHAAVSSGSLKVVQLLCSLIDVNATNKNRETPLHIAAEKGFCEIFLYLTGRGADWRMITRYGDTVMDLTLQKTNTVIKIFDSSKHMAEVSCSALKETYCHEKVQQSGMFSNLAARLRGKCCIVQMLQIKEERIADTSVNAHGKSVNGNLSELTEGLTYQNASRLVSGPFDLVLTYENQIEEYLDSGQERAVANPKQRAMSSHDLETKMKQMSIDDSGHAADKRFVMSKTLAERYLSAIFQNNKDMFISDDHLFSSDVASQVKTKTVQRMIRQYQHVKSSGNTNQLSMVIEDPQIRNKEMANSNSVYSQHVAGVNFQNRDRRIILAIMFDLDPAFFHQRLSDNYEICYSPQNTFELHIVIKNSKHH